jgi:hypothetical protein
MHFATLTGPYVTARSVSGGSQAMHGPPVGFVWLMREIMHSEKKYFNLYRFLKKGWMGIYLVQKSLWKVFIKLCAGLQFILFHTTRNM